MVEFGGWEMPVQYASIVAEHRAVRTGAGVFDISHMGEVEFRGSAAAEALNVLLTNNIHRLGDGQGQYTFLLNEQGGVIDDLIVYRREAGHYFAVINAARIAEDVAWMSARLPQAVTFVDRSRDLAGIALQGPDAIAVLTRAVPDAPVPARFALAAGRFEGVELLVARTGYTGEDGVELFVPNASAGPLWSALIREGAVACGLGARDSLRLEACLPLNGSDLGPDISPLEAGMGFAVDLSKETFDGRERLIAEKQHGPGRRLVAITPEGRAAPPRGHYPLFLGDRRVGEVTSGTHSPTLGHGIGLALVEAAHADAGVRLEMEVRGQRVPVVIVKKPFYRRST
jgi:aminomethyltransferase